jgi:hypothetical protein
VAVQRQSDQSGGTGQDGAVLAKEQLVRARAVAGKANARHTAVTEFIGQGVGLVDSAKQELDELCDKYQTGFERMQVTLSKAGETVKERDEIVDTVLGVAIGVGMGLGVGEVIVLSEGAGLAATAGQNFVGEVGEWWVGAHLKDVTGPGRTSAEAGLKTPDSLRPELRRLDVAMKLVSLYRELAQMGPETEPVHQLSVAAGKAETELTVEAGGGKGKIDIGEATKRVDALVKIETAQAGVDDKIKNARTKLQQVLTDAKKASASHTASDLEQEMWIHWMGGLSREQAHKLLDVNEIEDRLKALGVIGPGSRLGVDFGVWTSEADTEEAMLKAKWESRKLKMVGVSATIQQIEGDYAWVYVEGQPKLFKAQVNGGTPTVGAAAIVTGVSGGLLQVALTGWFGRPHEFKGPPERELEYEGKAHPIPGHL